ncbi:Armadillo-like helical [Artemisia annua]|uniref:Armadillo-like helical n=1 Tax=Artemisia annua TaxID=35608 RepID=A0A2U1QIE6_ARTAN|nr:Armadillo-like helical [Artemisia annua]
MASSSENETHRSLLSYFAFIILENIPLLYLKRSLVEELVKRPESFGRKLIGSYIPIISNPKDLSQRNSSSCIVERIPGNGNVPIRVCLRVPNMINYIPICILSNDDFSKIDTGGWRPCWGIARLTYEFTNLISKAFNVLPSAFLLLPRKNREINKVLVAKSQAEGLPTHMRGMVEALLSWQGSHKDLFKAKNFDEKRTFSRRCLRLYEVKITMRCEDSEYASTVGTLSRVVQYDGRT